MNKKIVGVFYSEHEASQAIQDLKHHGFQAEDISVIARNKRDVNSISDETGTKAPEGMASGAATGGLLGGLTGLLAGIGALAIPGIGPIIAAGPIAATLAGAAVGAGTGGLVGGLIGLGIPEDEAKSYDNYVSEGRILVMVDADHVQVNDVYSVFRNHHSVNSDRYVDAAFNGSGLEGRSDTGLDTMNSTLVNERRTADYTTDRDLDEDRKLRLREEQLDVSKNKVQSGEVAIHKDVVEEQKTINVPVTREEIVIERHSVNNDSTSDSIGADETIRIPVSEEKVEVRKNTAVTGEVDVHKREYQDTEQVRDTVKREETRVDKTGDVKVSGSDELSTDRSRTREEDSMYNRR
ncbi:YsnF/AvaK domain-containing protein [Paenibacillus sp. BR2-3]|uniref:YsnF/AvaK domain-containing protein n=1 Tax=Paenibacillus sp. BR2-3 TaxID=3048494 RepID=UPI003977905E